MTLMFVFVPSVHDRNPLSDYPTDGHEQVHEIRSIPGSLIGVGGTQKEAVARVIDLINWTIEDSPKPEAWYRESWAYADSGDDKIFGRAMTEQHQQLRQPREIGERAAYGLVPALT